MTLQELEAAYASHAVECERLAEKARALQATVAEAKALVDGADRYVRLYYNEIMAMSAGLAETQAELQKMLDADAGDGEEWKSGPSEENGSPG